MLEMTEEDYIKTLTEEFTKTYGKPVSDTGLAGQGEESSGRDGKDRKVVDTDYYGTTTYIYIRISVYFSVCVVCGVCFL